MKDVITKRNLITLHACVKIGCINDKYQFTDETDTIWLVYLISKAKFNTRRSSCTSLKLKKFFYSRRIDGTNAVAKSYRVL